MSSAEKVTTVPFGKYKGHPVENMLADTEYMTWLEGQPWFRERFAHLRTAKEIDAMSRTPVHNKLQALFLDLKYVKAFCDAGTSKAMSEIKLGFDKARDQSVSNLTRDAKRYADEVERQLGKYEGREQPSWLVSSVEADRRRSAAFFASASDVMGRKLRLAASVRFESDGADVLVILTWQQPKSFSSTTDPTVDADELERRFAIEIKPVVADDYPAVLRQMSRNRSRYLFVDRYTGEGATEAQFVQIFAASGKIVVFKRDVDAAFEAAGRP